MRYIRPHISLMDATLAVCLVFSSGTVGLAQSRPTDLAIELNKLQQTQRGCQLTFLASNHLAPISRLTLEMAFFKKDGLLEKLSVLDFRSLPKGKSRVRQFAVKDIRCDDLGQILINDVAACESVSKATCIEKLTPKNRSKIKFGD